jgi:hypothetical protein
MTHTLIFWNYSRRLKVLKENSNPERVSVLNGLTRHLQLGTFYSSSKGPWGCREGAERLHLLLQKGSQNHWKARL